MTEQLAGLKPFSHARRRSGFGNQKIFNHTMCYCGSNGNRLDMFHRVRCGIFCIRCLTRVERMYYESLLGETANEDIGGGVEDSFEFLFGVLQCCWGDTYEDRTKDMCLGGPKYEIRF